MQGIAIIVPNADFSASKIGTTELLNRNSQLAYIKAGKSSCINTGVNPSKNNKYEITFSVTGVGQPFGSRVAYGRGLLFYQSTTSLAVQGGGGSLSLSGATESAVQKLIIDGSNGGVVLYNASEEVLASGTISGYDGNVTEGIGVPLGLFGILNSELHPIDEQYQCKVYSLVIKSGDTIIHNFVPYLDKELVPCFKDTISNTLHYFMGTDAIYYSVNGVTEYEYES